MRSACWLILAALVSVVYAGMAAKRSRLTFYWIPYEGGYVRLNDYSPANCLDSPGDYCEYTTNINFTASTLTIQQFQTGLSLGWFRPHDADHLYSID